MLQRGLPLVALLLALLAGSGGRGFAAAAAENPITLYTQDRTALALAGGAASAAEPAISPVMDPSAFAPKRAAGAAAPAGSAPAG